jgi:hypothetical protein
MPLGFRWSPKLGPFRLNFGKRGLNSVTTKVGRWSHNSRTGRHRFNLPGPWWWTSRKSR